MTYPCTIYIAPHGRTKVVEIANIYPEDEAFFKQHGVILSMESLANSETVVYGRFPHQEEEDETIVFASGRSCQDTLKELASSLIAIQT